MGSTRPGALPVGDRPACLATGHTPKSPVRRARRPHCRRVIMRVPGRGAGRGRTAGRPALRTQIHSPKLIDSLTAAVISGGFPLRQSISTFALAFLCIPAFGQQQDAAPAQGPAVKATAEEVVLDFIVRDKKGKPITDLK